MERDATRRGPSDTPEAESGLEALRESGAVRSSFVAPDRHERNEHIAFVYESRAEQFAVAVPFVRQGLERGEKCLYVVDDRTRDDLVAAMRADGIDVETARESGALTFLTEETYIGEGPFTPDEQLDFLADAIESATEEFPAARVAVEMTCFLGDDLEYDDLVAYEERYNSLSADADAVALCQYNRNRFPAEVVRDTLRAHPHLVVDETLSHNVYYRPPAEFFDPEQPSHEVERMLSVTTDLAEAETTLKRQNERLDEFADIVSHDLRNPLNVAAGHLQLAREETESEHLDAVDRAHGRMETLVDDLLALARQGDLVEDPEQVELAPLVESCWRSVDTASARLRTETDATVRADGSRLQQLLENLVRNAIEHGGEDVTVTVGELDGAGFYVEDSGSGFPEDERERVFESGFSTTETGTGFGLAIVRRIADAHGWTVGVTDGADGGARFEFRGVEVGD